MEKKAKSTKTATTAKASPVAAAKAAVKKVLAPKAEVPAKAMAKPAAKAAKLPADFGSRVEYKAYELYIQRGAGHGDDQGDWFEAERLVRAELGV